MATEEAAKKKERKKRSISSFSILLIMLVALAVITMIMGGLGVEGVEGAKISQIVMAPVQGFGDAIDICLFVLILGGFLGIVTETGALDAGIAALVHKLKGNELVLIPILMFLFSIGGTTYGMLEETVPFYLLLAATMVAAGFDSVVGVATVLLGAGCGVLGSTVNPFATGVAIASLSGTGIEINQGIIMALGVVLWLSSLGLSIFFVMRYAKKVKADKGSTILSLQEQEEMMQEWGLNESAEEEKTEDGAPVKHMTTRQKWSLIVFGLTFVVMIVSFIPWADLGVDFFDLGATSEEVTTTVGAEDITAVYDEATETSLAIPDTVEGTDTAVEEVTSAWSAWLTGTPLGTWYFGEASTWFLLMAFVIGLIGGIGESRFVKAFINGAADMMSVVLIIALARSVTVLMQGTGLSTWILDAAANGLQAVPAIVFAPLSYILFVLLSFLIPSSSGMATVAVPIMGGLAAHLNFSVETMIMIFVAGNGLVNLFTPTCGAIMGGLALAKVEYSTWLKFGAKLFVMIAIVSIVVLTVAMMFIPMTA